MTKKMIIVVIVLVAAAAAGAYYMMNRGELASERAAGMDINTSSLEGEVLFINGNKLVVRTGRVDRSEVGNVVVEYDKMLVLADARLAANLKIGDRAVFYGPGYASPLPEEEFIVTRVEILDE